ncbi:MAG: VWA domain-containing protein [Candidatus Bipolaricaulota bacterium]|nr:MAG: VWA domain-containing protein [Candidatus Bipolaricaulota bacterium]
MRSRALWIAGVVMGSLLLAVPAVAQTPPGCGVAPPPAPPDISAGAANVAIILDASNSMNAEFGAGTRLEAAKDALLELIDVLPLGLNVRLSIYGHRVPKQDREASCEDLQRVYGPEPFTEDARGTLASLLPEIVAQGLTPLEAALLRASEDLVGYEGQSVIILLSDGEETCDGDPLAAAALLASYTPPISVHVVGLDVEESARETLMAIAEITGGQYLAAAEASEVLSGLFALLAAGAAEPEPDLGIPAEYACLGITNVIVGTEEKDTLIGTEGNDLIYGLGGNDLIVGLGGNDVLLGGEGSDVIEGGEGCDVLLGEGCNDVLFGGSGDDLLCGGPGKDSIEGEAGNDRLNGGLGDDYLLGGEGRDILDAGGGMDLLLEGDPGTVSCAPCDVPCPPTPVCPVPCDVPEVPCAPAPPEPPCPPTCDVPVAPPPPSDCDTKSVDEGSCIQLHGTVVDHDCNVVTVMWQADKGSFDDPTSLNPMYCAPMTPYCEGEEACITLIATDSCGATGQDAFTLHINNVNHAPLADAGEDLAVDEGATVQLTCAASDPDGDAVSILWTSDCGRGTFHDPTQLHPCYTAPTTDRCEGEAIVLTMTVTDACGAQSSDSIVVYVRNVNHAPSADAGEDLCVDEGGTVLLTCAASDPDGDALSILWTSECGQGVFNDPTLLHPTFTAPYTEFCEGEAIVLTMTVTDECGAVASDSIVIHVNDLNQPPVAELGPGFSLDECTSVQMVPVVSDPECKALTYHWTASAGSFDNAYAANPIYTAPSTDECDGIDVVITLVVTDPCGLTACATTTLHINNINNAPLVIADP